MTEHLAAARESAQQTYDRRRARKAADTLAQIMPNRWDDETRRIVATLATVSAPSRIDNVLDEAFEPPIGGLNFDGSTRAADACDRMPDAPGSRPRAR